MTLATSKTFTDIGLLLDAEADVQSLLMSEERIIFPLHRGSAMDEIVLPAASRRWPPSRC
jgi:hypothetical protein